MAAQIRAAAVCALGLCCGLRVGATVPTEPEPQEVLVLRDPVPSLQPTALASLERRPDGGRTEPGPRRWSLGDGRSSMSVVQLPPQGDLHGSRQRAHHALLFPAEGPRRMLSSFGLETNECNVRLRLPTRLQSTATGVRADLRAQAVLGCQF